MLGKHFQRTTAKQPVKRDLQARLLILILVRSVSRHLNEQFLTIKRSASSKRQAINLITKTATTHSHIHQIKTWEQLKSYARSSRNEEKLFRNFIILSNRFHREALRVGFASIHKYVYLPDSALIKKIGQSKKNILFQGLERLVLKRKKQVWAKMTDNLRRKRLNNKFVIVLVLALKKRHQRVLSSAWNTLTFQYRGAKGQNKGFELQIQDLQAQIQNKNADIYRLQSQIDEMKQSSYYNPNSFQATSRSGRITRKNKSNTSIQKNSNDGSYMKDMTYGSIFSSSLKSFNSKKNDKCDCDYRVKYDKYRTSAQSYKKQLQIIKAELQFTKEMNQEMQNEIKRHMGTDQKQRKIEKLRIQLKQMQKDRDHLLDKVIKYEKYTAKLKSEFKIKIQEIYRKVKKGT